MLKNIIRFNLRNILLTAGIAVYYIKSVETAISSDNILMAICLAPFCIGLFLIGLISMVIYTIRLLRLDVRDLCQKIKTCKKCFAGCHYFFGDYLLTLELPAKIYFREIEEISAYSYGRIFYIKIRTRSGKRYTLKQFRKNGNILAEKRTEGFDTHTQMTNLILMMNGSIKHS